MEDEGNTKEIGWRWACTCVEIRWDNRWIKWRVDGVLKVVFREEHGGASKWMIGYGDNMIYIERSYVWGRERMDNCDEMINILKYSILLYYFIYFNIKQNTAWPS